MSDSGSAVRGLSLLWGLAAIIPLGSKGVITESEILPALAERGVCPTAEQLGPALDYLIAHGQVGCQVVFPGETERIYWQEATND